MSSDTHTHAAVTADQLKFMAEHYLPEARWTLGGAFRFDSSLRIINEFLAHSFPLRRPERAAGTPPCKWSLDWFAQRRPYDLATYGKMLDSYANKNFGVTLVFDNPYITEDMLHDGYANALVNEFYRRDRIRKNAICVASDLLAAFLRQRFPKLPVFCHANRLATESRKRTASLYNKLAHQYDRVCLHPSDAVRPFLYAAIDEPDRFDIIINDPCLRSCPVRRDHIRMLADMRQDPYDMEPMSRRARLIDRNACHDVDASRLKQKATCNLTRKEATALYAAGYRSFIVQSSQFRNEMTFLWDIFHCMLDNSPEISNKNALVTASAIAMLSLPKQKLASGLCGFSFSNYE